MKPIGIVLAGGLARRIGGDKGLLPLAGRPLLAHVLDRVRPQVGALALNVNGEQARYREFGLPLLPDPVAGFQGPLAGILAGMEWARTLGLSADDLLVVPCDTPFLPADLAVRLFQERRIRGAEIALAESGKRIHPVVGLWPLKLADALRHAVARDGVSKVEMFARRYPVAAAAFSTEPIDPFLNINQAVDLARAECIIDAERRA